MAQEVVCKTINVGSNPTPTSNLINPNTMKNLLLFLTVLLLTSCAVTKDPISNDSKVINEVSIPASDTDSTNLFNDVNVNVTLNIVKSLPIDTVKRNIFLVRDLNLNLEYQQCLPVGSDFWMYHKKGTVEIVDTLEFYK